MPNYKARTKVEIELDFMAKNKDKAQKILDNIEVRVNLIDCPQSVEEFISSKDEIVNWEIEVKEND